MDATPATTAWGAETRRMGLEGFNPAGLFYLFLCVAACSTLPDYVVHYSLMITAHAHFLLAYIYRYRAGKMDAAAAFTVVGLGCFFILNSFLGFRFFIGIASGFFIIHYLLDELSMARRRPTLLDFLMIGVIAFSYSAILYDQEYQSGFWPAALLAAKAAFTLMLGLFILRPAMRHYNTLLYLLLLGLVIGTYDVLKLENFDATRLFGVVIFHHFFTWYWEVFRRLQKHAPEKIQGYFIDMLGANALFLFLFVLAHADFVPYEVGYYIYYLLFRLHSYFAWAMVHFLYSLRREDFHAFRAFRPG